MPASCRFPAAVVALIEGKRKTHRQGPQAARRDNDDNFHTRAVRQHAGLLLVLVAASPGAVLIPFAFVAGAAPHLGCAAMSAWMEDEKIGGAI
jgi:hypothetical protein